MWLKHIEADRFRNLNAVQLDLPQGLTVLAGRNGQGKTSILESIYLLGTGRSFRSRRQEEWVNWEGGPLRVLGEVENRRGAASLTVVIHDGQRSLLVNGNETELVDYLGWLDLIDLSAARMDVLKQGPAERRKFLDRGVVGLTPSFLHVIGEYRHILLQRNALLRGGEARDVRLQLAQLEVWDERLAQAAAELHRHRREYAVRLASRLGEVERALFPNGGELRLRYRPSPAAASDVEPSKYADVLLETLRKGRQRDLMVGHTSMGPHRDELKVELNGTDLRKFGSAGQVRAAMIGLKIAKLELAREERGEAPLFLMDDFDTDIDEKRASALAEFIFSGGFQAVVATSKIAMIDALEVDYQKVLVHNGKVDVEHD